VLVAVILAVALTVFRNENVIKKMNEEGSL